MTPNRVLLLLIITATAGISILADRQLVATSGLESHDGEMSRTAGIPVAGAQAVTPVTFKIAHWNIRAGFGLRGLAGRTCTFTDTGSCTAPPLNAWGMHVVQDELIRSIGNDPEVVALGLAEAWTCATPTAVQHALGWNARSSSRSGIAIVARFGFAGPEEWLQLDTSRNTNPADTKFVLRVPVCLDQGCTRSVVTYTTHMYGAALTDAAEYTNYAVQASQILDFVSKRSGNDPHVILGDLNIFEGTRIVCGQKPKNEAIQKFRSAGYLDAWPTIHAMADGSTGMWNRAGCGVPEGNLWKRIDYSFSKRLNPLSVSRFGLVTPGECAPSDHAGLIAQYAVEDASAPVPTVEIAAPVSGATVQGLVSMSALATDATGVTRLEWLLDGNVIAVHNSAPFTFTWDTRQGPNGGHALQAAASNAAGRRTVSSPRSVVVFNPSALDEEIVLYAADATITGSGWSVVDDATAASGRRLQNANAGATVSTALASPSAHAELTFQANAGTPYRLWLRGKSIGNSPDNDAVHVQFSSSVATTGTAVFRIGTSSSTRVNIEDCVGCGLSNWGWQDNEIGRDVLGPLIYFGTSGTQRLRIQALEDGLGIDQVVLSAVSYRFGSPGLPLNDTTMLPRGGNQPPTIRLTAPASGTTLTAPASVTLTASASDSDGGVLRVEFFANDTLIGQAITAPYSTTWSNVATGQYVLTARATDTAGAITTSAAVALTVAASPRGSNDEIVLRLARQAQLLGGWTVAPDQTAADDARLQNADARAPKLITPLAAPTQAFELTFNADAGQPYRLWIRGKAQNDSYLNDSVFVQFDKSVDAAGAAVWRIGTTSATPVILEDCGGCGVQGWGWADNGYGLNLLGPVVYFAQSGTQRLRIQMREDGLGIDQVVLSAGRYLTVRPGSTKNDTTILPLTPAPSAGPVDEVVFYTAVDAQTRGAWNTTPDGSAAGGTRLQNPNAGAPKLAAALANPTDYFELTFNAEAGKPYRLWIRGKAQNDSYLNDSVFVQFDESVDAAGAAVWRIGTTSATPVILEDCGGCGVQGWGWSDNGYGTMGPVITFAQSGPQRLRIQVREDGLGIDEVILSAVRYFTNAPGATKDDTTIVPR